jgi:hypothetical protein
MTRSKGGVKKCIVLIWGKIAVDSVHCTVQVYEPKLGDTANGEDGDDNGLKVIGGKLVQMDVSEISIPT